MKIDDSALRQFIHEMQARIDDPRPYFRWVANQMRVAFRKNFEQGGRPPWVPLRPSTVKFKEFVDLPTGIRTPRGRRPRRLQQRGEINGSNILIMSGDLRDSASQSTHPDHIQKVSKQRVEVGTKHRLAVFHQYGTKPYVIRPVKAQSLRFMNEHGTFVFRKSVHHTGLPARPFLTLTPDEINHIKQEAIRWVVMGEFGNL